jgi:hypothetical protein
MLIGSSTSGVASPRHDLTTMADKLKESHRRDLVNDEGLKALEAYALLVFQSDFATSFFSLDDARGRVPLFERTWLDEQLDTWCDADLIPDLCRSWAYGAGWASLSNYAPTVRDNTADHPAIRLMGKNRLTPAAIETTVLKKYPDEAKQYDQFEYRSDGTATRRREFPGCMLLFL